LRTLFVYGAEIDIEAVMNLNYKELLRKDGLLSKARKWLKSHPKPLNWEGDKWSYAYTEMPIF